MKKFTRGNLENNGIYVLAQEDHGHQRAIDTHDEQKIRKHTETSSEVTQFAASSSLVTRWCL